LVNDQIYTGVKFKRPAALTNKKQESIDKIHDDNIDRLGVSINGKKNKDYFFLR
jgi:hypothetical protein